MRQGDRSGPLLYVPTPIEYERRFLVDGPQWRQYATDPVQMTQGWLVFDESVQVRVRCGADWGSMACKVPTGTVGQRIEIESEIDVEYAREILKTCRIRLEKIRWHVRCDGYTYDVDEYLGDLAGIVTAEVEFPDVDFVPAEWLGREVTEDVGWSNGSLARNGRPDA